MRICTLFSYTKSLKNKRTIESCAYMNNPILSEREFHFYILYFIIMSKPPLLKTGISRLKILDLKNRLTEIDKYD